MRSAAKNKDRTAAFHAHCESTCPFAEVMIRGGRHFPRRFNASSTIKRAESTRSTIAIGNPPTTTDGSTLSRASGEYGSIAAVSFGRIFVADCDADLGWWSM